MGRATQGEKAEIVRELRAEGYQMKHLLTAIRLARLTHYFEMRKGNQIKARNKDLTVDVDFPNIFPILVKLMF